MSSRFKSLMSSSIQILFALSILALPLGAATPAWSAPSEGWRLVLAERDANENWAPSQPEKNAIRFLTAEAKTFGLSDPEGELALLHSIPTKGGFHLVTFLRVKDGIIVQGKRVTVYLRPDGSPAFASSDLAIPNGAEHDTNEQWQVTEHQALNLAASILINPKALRAKPKFQKAWYSDDDKGTLIPAWEVMLATKSFMDLRVTVDAHDATRILSIAKASSHSKANAFETNPAVSDMIEVDLVGLDPEEDRLIGTYAHVATCRLVGEMDCDLDYLATPDDNRDYMYQPQLNNPTANDPFAEAHAYYHVNRVQQMFANLGMDSQLLLGLQVMVNIEGFDNAAFAPYDDGMLIFGMGRRNFAYDADVIYHEYTHAVVEHVNTMEFGFDAQGINYLPGALNEANADTFSSILAGDPVLGEYVGGHHGSIRRMDGNHTCPADQVGMVHDDGLLWAQPAWEFRDVLDGDEEARAALLWDVLLASNPRVGYQSFAEVAVAVARERHSDEVADQIHSIVDARGLYTCGRVVDLNEVGSHSAYNLSASDMFHGQTNMAWPSFLQYKITVPEGVGEVNLDFTAQAWGGQTRHRILVRYGREVGMQYGFHGSIAIRADQEFDHTHNPIIYDRFGGELTPGDYYVAIMNDGYHSFVYGLGYSFIDWVDPDDETVDAGVEDPNGEGDAGLDPPGGNDDAGFPEGDAGGPSVPDDTPKQSSSDEGCGCSSIGNTRSYGPGILFPLFLAFFLLFPVRRRSLR